jgi:hypothetical protein
MAPTVDVVNLLLGLAWLGEVNTNQVRRLWLPQHSSDSVQRLLNELRAEGYVERRRWALPQPGRPPILHMPSGRSPSGAGSGSKTTTSTHPTTRSRAPGGWRRTT